MTKIFWIIKGLFSSLLQKREAEPRGLKEHMYFCSFINRKMGIVLQQPSLCALKEYSLLSTRQDSIEAFLESLYRFLQGATQLNVFSDRSIKIIIPYSWYWLVIMNLDHWQSKSKENKLLIRGIAELLTSLVDNGNYVEIKGSWPWRPGLKAAYQAAKDEYRLE